MPTLGKEHENGKGDYFKEGSDDPAFFTRVELAWYF